MFTYTWTPRCVIDDVKLGNADLFTFVSDDGTFDKNALISLFVRSI